MAALGMHWHEMFDACIFWFFNEEAWELYAPTLSWPNGAWGDFYAMAEVDQMIADMNESAAS